MNIQTATRALLISSGLALFLVSNAAALASADNHRTTSDGVLSAASQSQASASQPRRTKHRYWRHRGGRHPHYGSRRVRIRGHDDRPPAAIGSPNE